jgi:ATP-dependent Clp protease protease subunit
MPSHSEGNRFFLNEFDESLDAIMLDIIGLVQHKDTARLEFWINSEGGDAYRAFALVELISLAKQRGITVQTFVLAEAFSAGSMVAVAGSPGYRFVAPSGVYMIHYGEAEQTATSPIAAGRVAKANKDHFNRVLQHYKDHTKIPQLKRKMQDDFLYLTADQAIEYGLADGYLEHRS